MDTSRAAHPTDLAGPILYASVTSLKKTAIQVTKIMKKIIFYHMTSLLFSGSHHVIRSV